MLSIPFCSATVPKPPNASSYKKKTKSMVNNCTLYYVLHCNAENSRIQMGLWGDKAPTGDGSNHNRQFEKRQLQWMTNISHSLPAPPENSEMLVGHAYRWWLERWKGQSNTKKKGPILNNHWGSLYAFHWWGKSAGRWHQWKVTAVIYTQRVYYDSHSTSHSQLWQQTQLKFQLNLQSSYKLANIPLIGSIILNET